MARNRIIYLPFENLPQRYTQMWNDAVIAELDETDVVVYVDSTEQVIQTGEFLDVYGTNIYKQKQLLKVCEMFQRGEIHDGDTFFIPDLFYTGMEALRYMAELTGLNIHIATFNHAGRADKDDFVQRLGAWSDSQEQSWHEQSDLVFVGSQYQARRVAQKYPTARIYVSGAVWSAKWMNELTREIRRKKQHYIIWPHRPCAEKRFDLFCEIAQQNPDLHFVITSGGPARLNEKQLPHNVSYRYGLTKKEYYELFAAAEGFLSTAYQETFGYTIQEAIYFGCKIICPDYACYREYVAPESIVPFDSMALPNYLTRLYANAPLTNSKQLPDNAGLIVKLIKDL